MTQATHYEVGPSRDDSHVEVVVSTDLAYLIADGLDIMDPDDDDIQWFSEQLRDGIRRMADALVARRENDGTSR